MRIEINAGGGATVHGCCSYLDEFRFDTEAVLSSFTAVRKQTEDLNGGIGALGTAYENISQRISQETNLTEQADKIRSSFLDFLEHTETTDRKVAVQISASEEKLYVRCPRLKRMESVERENWYSQALIYLTDGNIADFFRDTLKNAWESLKDFYAEHKKIIDTIGIVLGAVASIALVVGTHGAALGPLLHVLGLSTQMAGAVSAVTAVLAIAASGSSAILDIIDLWYEPDSEKFKAWQKGAGWANLVFNGIYSLFSIYNSIKGVSGREYIARQKAIQNGKNGYGSLNQDHPKMQHKSSGAFDSSRKKAIYEENMRRNDGVLRSDQTGKPLVSPKKSAKGIKPSDYEAQVDHIFPKSKGGTNDFNNAQVIERKANRGKTDKLVFDQYEEFSRPDRMNLKELLAWLGIETENLRSRSPVRSGGD